AAGPSPLRGALPGEPGRGHLRPVPADAGRRGRDLPAGAGPPAAGAGGRGPARLPGVPGRAARVPQGGDDPRRTGGGALPVRPGVRLRRGGAGRGAAAVTRRWRPRALRRGDPVAAASPCSPPDPDRLDAAVPVPEGWGLEVRVQPHARDRHPDLGHLAGTDADRANGLQDALAVPDVAAVFCARGGDGAHRTLERLDLAALRGAEPKAFVGFSDVTALHEALSVELGAVTLHGPVVGTAYFAGDTAAEEDLRAHLFEPESRLRIAPPGAEPLIGGSARGVLIGGNLSLLSDGLATPHSRPSAEGGLLLLEDVGEDVS